MNDYGWSYDEYSADIMKMFDMSGYTSPIEAYIGEVTRKIDTEFEENVCKVCMSYGINVNPDELIKALNYDRKQYEKGYLDACRRYGRPVGSWLLTDAYPHRVYCSNCYKTFAESSWEIWKDGSLPRDFCPSCGAKMEVSDDSNRVSDNDEED